MFLNKTNDKNGSLIHRKIKQLLHRQTRLSWVIFTEQSKLSCFQPYSTLKPDILFSISFINKTKQLHWRLSGAIRPS